MRSHKLPQSFNFGKTIACGLLAAMLLCGTTAFAQTADNNTPGAATTTKPAQHSSHHKRQAHHVPAHHRGHLHKTAYRHHRGHSLGSESAGVYGNRYAAIVVDAQSGQVLYSDNADSPRHPASLTKMMTLYLTFKALSDGDLNLDDRLAVSDHAAEQNPTKLYLHPGQTISVHDAILGLVTESANDAAVVLAEAQAGSEADFAERMTQEAHRLGMNDTHFANASGLPDPAQTTTAQDYTILARALIYQFPQFYPYFSTADFRYKGVDHHNHNHLMERYEGMDGIKTGFIRESGYNLAASAVRDGHRLVAVVFGGKTAASRDSRVAELLNKGFAIEEREANAGNTAPTMQPASYRTAGR